MNSKQQTTLALCFRLNLVNDMGQLVGLPFPTNLA